jgi:uncharacterized protein (TIGR02391 family)
MADNAILRIFPTADLLIAGLPAPIQRAVLRHIVEFTNSKMHPMTTCNDVVTRLLEHGGYAYDVAKRRAVETSISRAWKALEDYGLVEPPDIDNGKNGYRIVTEKGLALDSESDFEAAVVRGSISRALFHPALPDAAWNAFTSGDYDTAVFEAFKAIEIAVRTKGGFSSTDFGAAMMQKAFDPVTGPLTNAAATPQRRKRRCELFTGAFDELRNPKAHGDPTITNPLLAVEEMMIAGALRRIVDAV